VSTYFLEISRVEVEQRVWVNMERSEKLELLIGLKPGPWRLSVKKELWPDFAESPAARVFGKFTR
jgi:hypothetical protein